MEALGIPRLYYQIYDRGFRICIGGEKERAFRWFNFVHLVYYQTEWARNGMLIVYSIHWASSYSYRLRHN